MKREWLLAAAVLIPIGLGTGCQKKTTPPVNTGPDSARPLGDLGPADTAAPMDAPAPLDVAPLPPAAPAPVATTGGTYIVQKGDGLMAIARKVYNNEHKWTLIRDANNLQPPYNIKVGQKLVIP